jgi:hypothetical protein
MVVGVGLGVGVGTGCGLGITLGSGAVVGTTLGSWAGTLVSLIGIGSGAGGSGGGRAVALWSIWAICMYALVTLDPKVSVGILSLFFSFNKTNISSAVCLR